MNILFLFVGLPHLSDNRQIFSSLIHEFKDNGHHVFASSRDNGNLRTRVDNEEGIKILRIRYRQITGVLNPIKKAITYQEYIIKQRH